MSHTYASVILHLDSEQALNNSIGINSRCKLCTSYFKIYNFNRCYKPPLTKLHICNTLNSSVKHETVQKGGLNVFLKLNDYSIVYNRNCNFLVAAETDNFFVVTNGNGIRGTIFLILSINRIFH